MSDDNKIPLTELAPAEVQELDLYQKREKIYTRKIEGFFQRIRIFTGWPLLLGYFLLPWFQWDGRQAILFDLPARKFHLLGITMWPQDFPLLAWLLIIAAFALFTITAFAGRVWCGYTCPQTVWTSIFMWAEQKTEGSRNQRIKLDQAPWSASKILKKLGKHTLWLGVAGATGMTFVGYFYPIYDLSYELLTISTGKWQFLWTMFFTLATYINAGWMREQVCMHMCPYARFQSVMFDKDTLIVSYDEKRGEPRGARKRDQQQKEHLGDCINCQLCVQVCPTGIDIRDGLQYQCIGCALCVDACNSVMDKMSYPRGLIRYTSERALEGEHTHWLRPRLVGYATAVLIMASLFTYTLLSRVPVQLDAIKDRNRLYIETVDGDIENVYTLRLLNMDQQGHEYRISVEGLSELSFKGPEKIWLDSGAVQTIAVRLLADRASLPSSNSVITFRAKATDSDLQASAESRFLGPI